MKKQFVSYDDGLNVYLEEIILIWNYSVCLLAKFSCCGLYWVRFEKEEFGTFA